jgi:hypothetical protein
MSWSDTQLFGDTIEILDRARLIEPGTAHRPAGHELAVYS